MIKRPFVLSGIGLAASIAVVATLLLPTNGGPAVHAAMIMQKLNEQIEQSPRLEIVLENISVDEATVDGQLQIHVRQIAGELRATVQDDEFDAPIEVDVSLAISGEEGWVLIRKLEVPDPEVQPFLQMFFPTGSETLVVLPTDAMPHEIDSENVAAELEELQSPELAEFLQKLIDSHEDYGATIEDRPDGTILLKLPIDDAEALLALEALATEVWPSETRTMVISDDDGSQVTIQGDLHLDEGRLDDPEVQAAFEEANITITTEERGPISVDEDSELIGTTLSVVYDPATEKVQSFRMDGFGDGEGSIVVNLAEGPIDEALLDSTLIITPNTRTLDLGALKNVFESFDHDHGDDD